MGICGVQGLGAKQVYIRSGQKSRILNRKRYNIQECSGLLVIYKEGGMNAAYIMGRGGGGGAWTFIKITEVFNLSLALEQE